MPPDDKIFNNLYADVMCLSETKMEDISIIRFFFFGAGRGVYYKKLRYSRTHLTPLMLQFSEISARLIILYTNSVT